MWSCQKFQINNKYTAEFPRMRQCAEDKHEEEGCNPTSVYQTHSNVFKCVN